MKPDYTAERSLDNPSEGISLDPLGFLSTHHALLQLAEYSFADIQSYSELTMAEKKFISPEMYEHLLSEIKKPSSKTPPTGTSR